MISKRKQWGFRLFLLLIVLSACLAFLELAIRLFPNILPLGYLGRLPLRGAELFHPGILARTPIEGVPIPYLSYTNSDFLQSPPNVLMKKGMVSPNEYVVDHQTNKLAAHVDRYGLLNPEDMTAADVLFMGDSFTLQTGMLSPPGLRLQLQEKTGLKIFNMGVSAIGPVREEWLLYKLGLTLKPKVVIWFFFGGNDLKDDFTTVHRHQQNNIKTYQDLYKDSPAPASYALHFLQFLSRFPVKKAMKKTAEAESPGKYLPGFRGVTFTQGAPVWFYQHYLRFMRKSVAQLRNYPGWALVNEAISRVHKKLQQENIDLLMVYIPTKHQVYLPYVEKDAALLHQMASFNLPPIKVAPEVFWKQVMENRDNIEILLESFCKTAGIDFLSLTPLLREQIANGIPGYWQADTHWRPQGQAVAVEPLKAWLAQRKILENIK